MTLVNRWHVIFPVACINSSDSAILAALQTVLIVDHVVRTQRHRLDADKFPMFSVGWLDLARFLSRFGSLLV